MAAVRIERHAKKRVCRWQMRRLAELESVRRRICSLVDALDKVMSHGVFLSCDSHRGFGIPDGGKQIGIDGLGIVPPLGVVGPQLEAISYRLVLRTYESAVLLGSAVACNDQGTDLRCRCWAREGSGPRVRSWPKLCCRSLARPRVAYPAIPWGSGSACG